MIISAPIDSSLSSQPHLKAFSGLLSLGYFSHLLMGLLWRD
jgi:hypothetical protein